MASRIFRCETPSSSLNSNLPNIVVKVGGEKTCLALFITFTYWKCDTWASLYTLVLGPSGELDMSAQSWATVEGMQEAADGSATPAVRLEQVA